jgi:Dyp-type peroxidase family
MSTAVTLDVADVQGLVVRGYGRLPHAAFLLCAVRDPAAARAFLRDRLEDATSGAGPQGDHALNVAFTAPGLVAVGLPGDVVADGFAAPFVEGMTTEHRRRLLGDVGPAAPERWAWGGPDTPPVHLVVLLYAATAALLDERCAAVHAVDALDVIGELRTDELGRREAFGFVDGLSQPRLAGLPGRDRSGHDASTSSSARGGRPAPNHGAPGRAVATGEFVLGYPNAYDQLAPRPLLDPVTDPDRVLPRDPAGTGAADLGLGGSYLVVRQLSQDVEAFASFLRERTRTADGAEDGPAQERLAAKMVGRWRSGAPLVLAPDADDPGTAFADFGYHAEDPQGLACPLGAHIRRANPRDALPPKPGSERSLRLTDHHRLLRRARSYTIAGQQGTERGLHFLCLVGDLSRQYEFVQHSWINDPVFDGLHDDADPLVAPRGARGGTFVEQAAPVARRHRGLPEFVRVRGGAYFFLPGMSALRYLAQLPPAPDEESR